MQLRTLSREAGVLDVSGVRGGKPEHSFWRYAAGDDTSAPGPRNFSHTQQDPSNTAARAGAGRSERGAPEREAPSLAGGTDTNVPIRFDSETVCVARSRLRP